MEVGAVFFRNKDRCFAKAVAHGAFQVGGAAQGDPVLRPAEHVEVLAQIGGQVKLAELGLAPAGIAQHRHGRHAVHAVVADARRLFLVLISDKVVAAVFPCQLPRADGAGAAVLVAEPHHSARIDGAVQRIDAVKQGVAVAFGAAIHVHLTLQLGALVVGAEGFQFMDEFTAGACRHNLAGLYGIHQQLQLRKLKGAAGQPVAAAAPAPQLDVIPQTAQGVDIAVDAFALGKNVLLFQQLYQLRYIEQVFFVGLLFQNAQKGQKLGFLAFLLGHGSTSGLFGQFFVERRAALGGKTEHFFQLIPVVGHKGSAHLLQRSIELVDLADEVFLIPQK